MKQQPVLKQRPYYRDISLVFPISESAIRAVSKDGCPLENFFINIHDYGNTGSASVPLALWDARKNGRIAPGDLVLLTAFGAGFHWAAVLLQF